MFGNLDQMKALGQVASLLGNKEKMRQVADDLKARIERLSAEGSAGGGAVRVRVTGKLKVEDITLDPALVQGMAAGGEQGLVEQAIQGATNEAIQKMQEMIKDETNKSARELGLPEVPGLGNFLS
ncbi:MAG: YbaB/EbfC family nucleoid-associated protein [Planctomycetota bacterium]